MISILSRYSYMSWLYLKASRLAVFTITCFYCDWHMYHGPCTWFKVGPLISFAHDIICDRLSFESTKSRDRSIDKKKTTPLKRPLFIQRWDILPFWASCGLQLARYIHSTIENIWVSRINEWIEEITHRIIRLNYFSVSTHYMIHI